MGSTGCMYVSGNGIHSSTGSQCSSKSHSPAGSLTSTMTLTGKQDRSLTPISGTEGGDLEKTKKIIPTPTADLDRTNDKVYDSTTQVVKAVMSLSQGVQQAYADQYLELVKKVGLELKSLLTSVDEIVTAFPVSAQREVEMAHKCYRRIWLN
ncbi:hypothetical protein WA026_002070 [Henosepilachna vigintioctopunctata]|uniref:Focal AT domain-containing protein n=1 Tax=Henosepilachna vigintioctopunctata TaxID=420089 RepID=A0AAW1TZE3_9CUCU